MRSSYTRNFGKLLFAVLTFIFIQCSEEEIQVQQPDELTTSAQARKPAATTSRKCSSCNYIVPTGVTTINAVSAGIKPGDVICFDAAKQYRMITFDGLAGLDSNPIIVTNCNGNAVIEAPGKYFILRFNNSKYFRVTGGNIDGQYGLQLRNSGSNGLVFGYLTTNFEVDHVEVSAVGFAGIMAKTDPTCDDKTIRGNFTMRNVSFHHNYIHDTHGEGFYIGHSSYGGVENATCGFRLPHTIENIKVYKNLVKNSGWDGIQVSSATVGAEIFSNTIENYATGNKPSHSSAIVIGGGTGGVCYNNYISTGTGAGISVFGLADNTVHNNIIINAANYGIFCDERTAPGNGYNLVNNTIINPGTKGILIYAETVPNNNVTNNIIVQPHTSDGAIDGAYVGKLSTSVPVAMQKNIFTNNVNNVRFMNPSQNDYHLRDGSPAIDAGYDISNYNILTDFYGLNRVFGASVDIGAAEF